MLRYRTQGILAAGIGFAVAACGDADIKTDLRPGGPPDVLAVLTQSQIDFLETAQHCRYVGGVRDPKAPGFVGSPLDPAGGAEICPESEADFVAANGFKLGASNFGFAIRVMFDELLEADRIETLDCDLTGPDGTPDGVTDDPLVCAGSLETTQPLTISCGTPAVELPYTGYYVPNGNRVTFPVGPSIYALPDLGGTAFATGTGCTVTIKDSVVDKENNQVTDARAYNFNLAELALIGSDPVDGNGTVVPPAGAAVFIFTAALDDASLDPQTETELTTAAGVAVPYDAVVDAYNADLDAIYIFPTGTWRPGDYIAKIKSGAMFSEVNGGEISFAADVQTSFSVSLGRIGTVPAANGIVPTTGGSLVIRYNDTLDVSTVTADEFELVDFNNNPVPFGVEVITDDLPNDAIEVTPTGTLAPTAVDMPSVARQRYTLRLKSSSSFANAGGKVSRGPFALSFRVQ